MSATLQTRVMELKVLELRILGPYFCEGVLRRVCLIPCDQRDRSGSRSQAGGDLLGLWPLSQTPESRSKYTRADTPTWISLQAEGPSAQHDIPED